MEMAEANRRRVPQAGLLKVTKVSVGCQENPRCSYMFLLDEQD